MVKSVYGELLVPVFGSDLAIPGFESFELSAAVRQDHYSDLTNATTTNPKFGFNWKPVSAIKVRGSYGTSFRAPALTQAVIPSFSALINYATTADPSSPTGSSTGMSLTNNNPDLQPESADTYSLGIEFKPLRGLTATATWFSVDYRNLIQTTTAATALANPLYSSLVIRNPTADQIAAVLATGLRIQGTPVPNPAYIVDGRPQNQGGVRAQGVDFTLAYQADLGFARLDAGAVGTLMTKFDVAPIRGSAYLKQYDTSNAPSDVRVRANVGLESGGIRGEIVANFNDSYVNNFAATPQRVKSLTTFDARIDYAPESGILEGFTLGAYVQNLFDKDPPFVNVDGGVNFAAGASPLGRLVTVSLSKKF
ncbi:MAG: TonB-dependent receptor [Sphingomonadales bacterium]|nr:MAG: TonB-dependent receptor [Sphingomonadales bacterium]